MKITYSYNRLYKIISKIKNDSNIRNGAIFTLFAFLNNGVSFFLLMVLAGYISPSGYGNLNLFNNLVTIISMIMPLGTTGYMAICFFRSKRIYFKKAVTSILIIATTISIICLFLILILGNFFSSLLGLSVNMQVIALFICYSQIFTIINLEIWRLKEQPIKYGLYSLTFVSLNFILTLYFVVYLRLDWLSRVYSQLILGIIFPLMSIYFIYKRKLITLTKWNKSVLKDTLIYGIPLIPHALSSWMRQGLDRYIINFYWDSTDVGLFSFALNFGNIIHIVGSAFNSSNAVSTFKLLSQETDSKQQIKKQIIIMSFLFIILAISVYYISYYMIPIAFPKYLGSIQYLLPVCISAIFQCIYYLFVNFLFYYKRTTTIMLITTGVSILHIILSLLFTKYGIIYTVYISLCSNIMICFLIFIYSQKYYNIFNHFRK